MSRGGQEQLERPITVSDLVSDLAALGVAPGDILLVHSALRAVSGERSMVLGGPVAIVEALQRALGPDGTLVMPAFSADYSEPASWVNPPAPEAWWPMVREHWPAFRPDRTPTHRIGIVPETFRAMRDVLRSDHPQSSFCAWGANASELLRGHRPETGLGDDSPLGTLHRMDGRALLIGCGWGSNTCFHLAEYRMRRPPQRVRQGAPMIEHGPRHWIEWEDLDIDTSDFEALGEAFEQSGKVRVGRVGRATARLFSVRSAVDFARRWLDRHR
ncbi:MAG: aminoglycoside N(3)-acetyltransferase [Polyangiales bacterium]